MGGRRKLKRASSKAGSAPLKVMNPDDVVGDDGADVVDELLKDLDARSQNAETESAAILGELALSRQAELLDSFKRQNARSRFEARKARKVATLAHYQTPDDPVQQARLQREAEQEEKMIKRICDELGVRIHEINADGHCLYSAIADQLSLLSLLPPGKATYSTTRLYASNYIRTHQDDFLPFLSEENSETESMTQQSFEKYCTAIRDTGVWGGEPEILALSRAFNVPIHVVQGISPPVVVHNPRGAPMEGDVTDKDRKVVRISYHRKRYGLGEHYNSLRPKGNIVQNTLQTILR